eukprot:SAG11_NODE_262_length_11529_cov_12.277603_3_plen_114_part_00
MSGTRYQAIQDAKDRAYHKTREEVIELRVENDTLKKRVAVLEEEISDIKKYYKTPVDVIDLSSEGGPASAGGPADIPVPVGGPASASINYFDILNEECLFHVFAAASSIGCGQ